MPHMNIADAVAFIRMEYAELPGLKLTWWQVQRLWGLSEDECAAALKILTDSHFLARTVEGAYVRHPSTVRARTVRPRRYGVHIVVRVDRRHGTQVIERSVDS